MLLSDWVYFAYGERVNSFKVIGVGDRWCWKELELRINTLGASQEVIQPQVSFYLLHLHLKF
jgi:hypothetical protein